MIFTSDENIANTELKKLNVNMNKNIKITINTKDVIQFLTSE